MSTATAAPTISTVGELRAAGHEAKPLRVEIRDNLLARLRAGEDPWPGLHGYEDTVIPQVERALLAGHDIVLLGERGQGKTRLLRTIAGLLDEWTPVIEGSELAEHPYEPITHASRRRAEAEGTPFASRGGTATSATSKSSPLPTPPSPTSSATSTR